MSVSQSFTPTPEKKKLRVDINDTVLQELELYLQAAHEDYPWLSLDGVVEQLLADALKKDRAFRSWLKQHQQEAQSDTAIKPVETEQANTSVVAATAVTSPTDLPSVEQSSRSTVYPHR